MTVVPPPLSSSSPGPRLSDAEREKAIEVLATSCAEGRLTLDEFSGRVDAAQRAVSLGELSPCSPTSPIPSALTSPVS